MIDVKKPLGSGVWCGVADGADAADKAGKGGVVGVACYMGYGLRGNCKGDAKAVRPDECCKCGVAITYEFVRSPYAAWLLPASPALSCDWYASPEQNPD